MYRIWHDSCWLICYQSLNFICIYMLSAYRNIYIVCISSVYRLYMFGNRRSKFREKYLESFKRVWCEKWRDKRNFGKDTEVEEWEDKMQEERKGVEVQYVYTRESGKASSC